MKIKFLVVIMWLSALAMVLDILSKFTSVVAVGNEIPSLTFLVAYGFNKVFDKMGIDDSIFYWRKNVQKSSNNEESNK